MTWGALSPTLLTPGHQDHHQDHLGRYWFHTGMRYRTHWFDLSKVLMFA